jgi:hypothetical protein
VAKGYIYALAELKELDAYHKLLKGEGLIGGWRNFSYDLLKGSSGALP